MSKTPLFSIVAKVVWTAFVITTPLLGVWAASSIAAYLNGPVWAVVLAGLLLFPILPLLWELYAHWRRSRAQVKKKRFLTTLDRVILRTLLVNLLFMSGLLATHPQKGFEALSTRGDWFLDGRSGPTYDAVRRQIFSTAENLAWLYESFNDNPFRDEQSDEPEPTPTPPPDETAPDETVPDENGPDETSPAPQPDKPTPVPGQDDTGTDPPKVAARSKRWPLPNELHPAVESIPRDAESSYKSVARYLKSQERDPLYLVKALHDYVADRVAYDAPALAAGRYPPQDAQTVFTKRLGVCAGYAKLLTAMGREAGMRIVYVVGDARTQGWDLRGQPHAWNAAEIDGRWYLIDATWNSGSVDGETFTKGYRTAYLFTPPAVFGTTHLPDKDQWQLRKRPLTRGEFMRQPPLAPDFYARGLKLIDPNRSQVTVSGSIDITVGNPRGQFMLANVVPYGSAGKGDRCAVTNGSQVKIRCNMRRDGRYNIKLFAHDERYGTYGFVGQLGANNS